jgi:hypothetical protein
MGSVAPLLLVLVLRDFFPLAAAEELFPSTGLPGFVAKDIRN